VIALRATIPERDEPEREERDMMDTFLVFASPTPGGIASTPKV
jgi:hypothetical protein